MRDKGWYDGRREGIEAGIEQGIEQGVQRGRQENLIEIIRNGFHQGFTLDQLSLLTGTSIREIKKIMTVYNMSEVSIVNGIA